MSRLDILFCIIILLWAYLGAIVWFTDIPLNPQYIPTILNGLVSSISILIGFTATVIAILFRKEQSKSSRYEYEAMLMFLALGPVLLLTGMYFLLITEADLQFALKLAMINLLVAFFLLLLVIHRHILTKQLRQ